MGLSRLFVFEVCLHYMKDSRHVRQKNNCQWYSRKLKVHDIV